MPNETYKFACRVCGKMQSDPPWGENDKCPTYDICDCCGVEFGYEDCNLKAMRAFREHWLSNGALWEEPQKKPVNWSLETQMENIPEEYK